MPEISTRGKYMPDSPIRKLAHYADQAKQRGIKVYHLNIGQPDIHTSDKVISAIKNLDSKIIGYSHSAGMESLRKKLVQYYKRFGIHISYEDILITTGGSEAISMSLLTCMNSGDEIIVPEPFYANYFSFAQTADAKVIPITAKIENGFALPSIQEFEARITYRTKAIIICNPNNPTGYVYSRKELEQLRDLVLKYDLFLISDEVYREFCYDNQELTSIMHLDGLEQHAILIDSMSKRYSATGLRTGALITRNKELIRTAFKFCQARLSPPYVGQIAGEAAIDTSAEYMQNAYNEYLERRNYLVNALNEIEGVYSPMPKGAFYTMAQLPIDDADKFCRWLLEEFSYKNQTVMMAPASGFYTTKVMGKKEVRIAYVLNRKDLKNAVECLRVALNEYPGRTI